MTFSNKKLLIVDGHNLLFKSFFGIPAFKSRHGKYVHGIVGFLGMLRKIINLSKCEYCHVVFDGEQVSERKKKDNTYKANRIDYNKVHDSENPFTQLDSIQRVLTYLKISWVETKFGQEADDLIATIVAQEKKMDKVISSFDSDFFTLLESHTKILRYRGKKSYFVDRDWVFQKYGVEPEDFSRFKSIVGDSADNIKGISGFGPVIARKVLSGERRLTAEEEKQMKFCLELILFNKKIKYKLPPKKKISIPNNLLEIKMNEILESLDIL
ncbi:MAG: hypothetical protein KAI16_00280 [Candidatus Pacebacteria bacterium]|nr:hypothetical protein [Candidatus Paceibacterota bacterium]